MNSNSVLNLQKTNLPTFIGTGSAPQLAEHHGKSTTLIVHSPSVTALMEYLPPFW